MVSLGAALIAFLGVGFLFCDSGQSQSRSKAICKDRMSESSSLTQHALEYVSRSLSDKSRERYCNVTQKQGLSVENSTLLFPIGHFYPGSNKLCGKPASISSRQLEFIEALG